MKNPFEGMRWYRKSVKWWQASAERFTWWVSKLRVRIILRRDYVNAKYHDMKLRLWSKYQTFKVWRLQTGEKIEKWYRYKMRRIKFMIRLTLHRLKRRLRMYYKKLLAMPRWKHQGIIAVLSILGITVYVGRNFKGISLPKVTLPESLLSIIFWVALGLIAVGSIIFLFRKWRGRIRGTAESGITLPTWRSSLANGAVVILGIILFLLVNLMIWKGWPKVYSWFTADMIFYALVVAGLLFWIFNKRSTGNARDGMANIALLMVGVMVMGRACGKEKKPDGSASSSTTASGTDMSANYVSTGVRFEGRALDHFVGPYQEFLRERFKENPLLADICSSESTSRHWEDSTSGKPLTNQNDNGTIDVGLCQINSVHLAVADSLGFAIQTPDGNADFAEWLFLKEGSTPWDASACRWRDHLDPCGEERPTSTVLAKLAGERIRDSSIVVSDSLWSEYIPTRGMRLRWEHNRFVPYEVQDELGIVYKMSPGHSSMSRYPMSIRFRSVDGDSLVTKVYFTTVGI